MILNELYVFGKISTKSSSRLDCTASTQGYEVFELLRARKAIKETKTHDATNINDLVVYYGNVPECFNARKGRKADKAITCKNGNVSSVFVPDVALPFGYGDVRGTSDAVLFVDALVLENGKVVGGQIEMFIARGQGKNALAIYHGACDGVYDEEISALRGKALACTQLENQ